MVQLRREKKHLQIMFRILTLEKNRLCTKNRHHYITSDICTTQDFSMIAHLTFEEKNLPLQRGEPHGRENCPLPHSGQFRCQKGLSTLDQFTKMTHCTVLPKTKKYPPTFNNHGCINLNPTGRDGQQILNGYNHFHLNSLLLLPSRHP